MRNMERFGSNYIDNIAILLEASLKFYLQFESYIKTMILSEDKKTKEEKSDFLYEISKAFSFGFLNSDKSTFSYSNEDVEEAINIFKSFLSESNFYFDVRDVFNMAKDEKNTLSINEFLSKDDEYKTFILCLFINKTFCHLYVLCNDMTSTMEEDVRGAMVESGIMYLCDKFLDSYFSDVVVEKSYLDKARKSFDSLFEGKL